MNINFHYFAIKTLAIAAGFDDFQAQQIAQYSQFVDDYSPQSLMTCSNIPKEITFSSKLDLYAPSLRGNFRPVSTGFSNAFEYAALIIKREQRLILSPFHFFAFDEALDDLEDKTQGSVEDMRVMPLIYGDNSLIDRMLHMEISNYQNGKNKNIALIRLGLLLHVFADTYAHQMFTGFVSWANRVNIIEVKNNITNEDITAPARAGIRGLFNTALASAPAIGHVQAGHNPDLSHISFAFSYEKRDSIGATPLQENTETVHSRDNSEAFLEAGRNIFCYLQKCRKDSHNVNDNHNISVAMDDLCHAELPLELKNKLLQGFMIEMPRRNTVSSLAEHWNQFFPEINYHYDSNEINRGFRLLPTSISQMAKNAFTAYSEEFYEYNIIANELLVALYGPRPRRN